MAEAQPRRFSALQAALVTGVLLAPGAAAADDIPHGRFGVATAFRQNVGELGRSYGLGFLYGFEAGYQAGSAGNWGVGLAWSALFKGWYFADEPSLVEQSIGVTELSFGIRLRRSLSADAPRFAILTGGASLLRTSEPLPPEEERVFFGPYAGLGLEEFVLGTGFVGFEARYASMMDGPASLSLLVSFTGGS